MFDLFDTGVKLHAPPPHLFKLPIDDPPPVPPPTECDWSSLKCPFQVPDTFFQAALSGKVPIVFAITYFVSVVFMNQINKRRQYKPWALSKTTAFFLFTVVHNIALALYSAITFAAMVRMVHVSLPGWFGPHGVVGAVDSLCKLHGPRGYGDAVTYNQTTDSWSAKNSLIHLAADNILPDNTDVGRIWNEGLAWWGFWFYLSKFYEVLDTMIILIKSKRSSTLQTYHHTGAMFCMWAGIRYMAAPIYMFVLINSFIHSLMYTFYTISTLGYKVPKRLKQTITTLQILQLVTGVVYASSHFFVSYEVPVTNIFRLASILSSPKAATEAVSSLVADATEVAQRAGDLPPWVKRLAYRAAGAEALAESVHDGHIYTDRHAAERRWQADNATDAMREEFEHRTHYETVNCIDTTGQAFAVWLNVAYLAPLTALFVRFFVKSYLRKGREGAKDPKRARTSFIEARRWSESAQEAARETAETVEFLGERAEGAIDDELDLAERKVDDAKNSDVGKQIKQTKDDLSAQANKTAEQVKNSNAGKQIKQTKDKVSAQASKTAEQVKNSNAGKQMKQAKDNLSSQASKTADQAKKAVDESNLEASYVKVKQEVQDTLKEMSGSRDLSEMLSSKSSTVSSSTSTKQTSSSSQFSSSSSTTTGTKSESRSEGEWFGKGAKPSQQALEPKDRLVPDPSATGEHLSYAGAVKEDLEPGDHGEQPAPVDGSMGFGLNG